MAPATRLVSFWTRLSCVCSSDVRSAGAAAGVSVVVVSVAAAWPGFRSSSPRPALRSSPAPRSSSRGASVVVASAGASAAAGAALGVLPAARSTSACLSACSRSLAAAQDAWSLLVELSSRCSVSLRSFSIRLTADFLPGWIPSACFSKRSRSPITALMFESAGSTWALATALQTPKTNTITHSMICRIVASPHTKAAMPAAATTLTRYPDRRQSPNRG